MSLADTLTALGIERIVWIDDLFAKRSAELADMVLNNLEAGERVTELREVLATREFDPEGFPDRLRQAIADLDRERRNVIMTDFFSEEAKEPALKTNELSMDVVTRACELLGVAQQFRWSFDDARTQLSEIAADGDRGTAYIIDLNESRGSENQGLEVLRDLWALQSRGIAFILTHAVDETGESEKEAEFRRLAETEEDPLGIPASVIAKKRLPEDASQSDQIERVFSIGLKRAGLRRAIHSVVLRARESISSSFDEVALSLLRISPEQLDTYVVNRAFAEGISELHVVERALTAGLSKRLRSLFATDHEASTSGLLLRNLRTIELDTNASYAGEDLAELRRAEVWDEGELVNVSLSPVACGDVFELDTEEDRTKLVKRNFLLLGQPCDISLRPNGRRAQEMGILVPIKVRAADAKETDKTPRLPFRLNGQNWSCDFHNAAMVRLSILDLASFRRDGRVRFDKAQAPADELLPSQQKIHAERAGKAEAAINPDADAALKPPLVNEDLALTLSLGDAFKHIRMGAFLPAREAQGGDSAAPDRVTWHLRRLGRIRMPFAASLLEQLLAVMGRRAFDLDFEAD